MNNWIDVSIPVSSALPVWPGDPIPKLTWLSQLRRGDEVNLSKIDMSLHSGTHIDAPSHFIDGGQTIDEIPLELLIGVVQVISVPKELKVIDDRFLDLLDPDIQENIFFKTNNSIDHLLYDKHFTKDFVAIDPSGAKWLVDHKKKVIGIDYLSVAPFWDSTEPHKILLGANVMVVEGLDLCKIEEGKYHFICLPIKIKGREAAPARVVMKVIKE